MDLRLSAARWVHGCQQCLDSSSAARAAVEQPQASPPRPLESALMLSPLAQVALPTMSIEMVLSALSAAITGYFWLVRARQERPNLKVFQLRDFRTSLRGGDEEGKSKRLSLTPMELGGVLVANNSLRQNSVVRFDCYLHYEHGWLKGSWGYLNDDKPPWNIPPQTSIAISPACFFNVPEDFEVSDDLRFRVEFITASGRRFSHRFSLKAPEL